MQEAQVFLSALVLPAFPVLPPSAQNWDSSSSVTLATNLSYYFVAEFTFHFTLNP